MNIPDLKCPACGNYSFDHLGSYGTNDIYISYGFTDQKVISELKKLHSLDQYSLVKCISCGLEFAQPICAPSAEWYGVLYKNLRLYPSRRWEYDFVLKNTMAGSSICDLGCGSGQFLQHAVEAGFKPTGFDFSEDAVASGRAKGLDVHHLGIDGLKNRKIKKCSVVVSFQVLEHLESPSDLFKSAQTLGEIDCKFWLSVPSDRRPSRVYSETDYLDLPPHHITHWTHASLESLGRKNGWSMSSLFYEPISVKQVIWNATVRSPIYKVMRPRMKKYKWVDRFVRAVFFIPIGLATLFSRKKFSCFSVLAKFERNVNV